MKRHKMDMGASKHHFSKHADLMHRKNQVRARPVMRGGIRL